MDAIGKMRQRDAKAGENLDDLMHVTTESKGKMQLSDVKEDQQRRATLGLPAQEGPSGSVEIMPLEDAGVDVAEVVVDADSSVAGRLLSDSGVPEGLLVSAIVRGDRVLVPRGSTRLLVGDLLVITTADQQYGSRDVQAWVRGDPVA